MLPPRADGGLTTVHANSSKMTDFIQIACNVEPTHQRGKAENSMVAVYNTIEAVAYSLTVGQHAV